MQLTRWSPRRRSAPSEAARRFLASIGSGGTEVPVTDPRFGAALDELGTAIELSSKLDADTIELAANAYWARSSALSFSARNTDECLRCYVRALLLFRELASKSPEDVPPPIMQGLQSNTLWFSDDWHQAFEVSAKRLQENHPEDTWFVSLAIALTREALRLQSKPQDDSPNAVGFERRLWTHMLNLTTMYCQRALLTKSEADADQAVELGLACLAHESDLGDRSQLEFNLSGAYRARHMVAGQQSDRAEWLRHAQAAVDHVLWDDPRRPARVRNLQEAAGGQG